MMTKSLFRLHQLVSWNGVQWRVVLIQHPLMSGLMTDLYHLRCGEDEVVVSEELLLAENKTAVVSETTTAAI
jgi:hypothetical protein